MEQKPSGTESKPNMAGYLWVIALSVGLAVGVGIGAV